MRRTTAALLLAGMLLAAGCAPAATVPKPPTSSPPASAPAADAINPTVTPPRGEIKVAPDLLIIAPSDGGYISADEVRSRAIAAMAQGHEYGTLTLTSLRFDAANQMWEAEFAADGRVPAAPAGRPADVVSADPVEQRRRARSWVLVADSLIIALDGKTGEVRGHGFRGREADLTRSDLEHYRGVILEGGEVVKLRLTRADGSREGRDLEVSLPEEVLTAAGLQLWQVQYGAGRQLEVWGLTSRPGAVVAYKVAMPSPPPDSLLAAPLVYSVPLYPGAYIKSDAILVRDVSLKAVQDWYRAQLPLYGFKPKGPEGDYENAAWDHIRLGFTTQDGAVAVTVTRP